MASVPLAPKPIVWLLLVGGVALLAGVVLLSGLVAKRVAVHRVHEAYRLQAEGRSEEAASVASTASNLSPHNLLAARTAVALTLQAGGDPAPALVERLFTAAEASSPDRALAMSADLAAGRRAEFLRKLEALTIEERRALAVLRLEIQDLVRSGNPARAMEVAHRARSIHPSAETDLLLAEVLLRATPGRQREISDLLLPLVEADRPESARAIELLATLPASLLERLPLPEDLPTRMASLQGTSSSTWLATYELERIRDPSSTPELAQRAIAWAGEQPSPEILEWLVSIGELQLARQTWDRMREAGQDAAYADFRLQLALAAGEQTDAIREIEGNPRLSLVQRALLRVAVANAAGQVEEAERWWQSALRAADAAPSADAGRRVADAAEVAGRPLIWAHAIGSAARKGPEQVERDELLQATTLLAANRQAETAREVTEAWARVHPSDPDARNNLAYLNLLLGRSPGESTAAAEELTARFPEIPAYRSTLALARFRAGRLEEALELTLDPSLPISALAVRAAALEAAGRPAEAQRLRNALDLGALLPIEADLLP